MELVDKYSIERLNRLLMALVGDEGRIQAWWTSDNLAFDRKTPLEIYNTNPTKVVNYILDQFHH